MTDDRPTPDEELAAEVTALGSPVPEHPSYAAIAAAVPSAIWSESVAGQTVLELPPGDLVAAVEAARQAGFDMFIDVTAVDYYRQRPGPRFDVVVGLLSLPHNLRLRIRVPVEAGSPSVPSIAGVYAGANFFEREVYDLFGIEFAGHPDLTRILLPDDWEGHPLRKDTPVGAVPVQFRDTPKVQ